LNTGSREVGLNEDFESSNYLQSLFLILILKVWPYFAVWTIRQEFLRIDLFIIGGILTLYLLKSENNIFNEGDHLYNFYFYYYSAYLVFFNKL